MSYRSLNVFGWVALAMLCFSVTVNVHQAERIDSFLEASARAGSRVGEAAVPLRGLRNGRPAEIRFDTGQPTVVYYFRSTCAWCEKNWPAVRALHGASKDRFRFVAVTAERSTADTLRQVAPEIEVLEAFDGRSRTSWRFTGTPHTVVVSGQGIVTHDWPGLYADRVGREIENLFDVRLPVIPRQ